MKKKTSDILIIGMFLLLIGAMLLIFLFSPVKGFEDDLLSRSLRNHACTGKSHRPALPDFATFRTAQGEGKLILCCAIV